MTGSGLIFAASIARLAPAIKSAQICSCQLAEMIATLNWLKSPSDICGTAPDIIYAPVSLF